MDETRLSSFLAGETSEAEAEAVRAWLAKSEANRHELARLRRIWDAATAPPPRPVDVDAAWHRLRGQMKTAAPVVAEPETPVVPLHSASRWGVWRVAASVVVLLGLGWLGYRLVFPPVVPLTEVASGNVPREITLPDGSRVMLNRASRLRYDTDFDEKTRAVTLMGEAFFDVAPNPARPFVIAAAGTEVRVLGTSFNVDARTPDVAVNVATGKVQFSTKNQALILTKNEAATFRATADTILKAPRANPNALAYKTRVLMFEATPLAEVVAALNHNYGVDITLSRALERCPLTVTFENESLDGVLGVLTDTFRLTVERGADGQILLVGKGCQ